MGKRQKRGLNGSGGITWDKTRKVWVARFSYRADDGKLKRPTYSAKMKVDAEVWLRKSIQERDSGLSFSAEKLLVGEYTRRWLEESAKPSIAPSTYKSYRQHVTLWIVPELGKIELQKLTPAHVEFFKNKLLETLAPATVIQVLRTLTSAIEQAVEWELVRRNAAKKVRRPRLPREEMRCLDEEEAARIVEVVRGTRDEAFYLLALKCGPRQGELAGLKWEDYDVGRRTLTISRSVRVEKGIPLWGPTKTGEERQIVLGEKLVSALERHRAMQAEERLAAEVWLDASLMFPNERGGVRTHSTIYKAFQRHLDAAGVERVRWHDLRDTFSSLALGEGVPVHVVADILGHGDPAITLRRYAHVLPSMSELAAERMNSLSF